MSKHVHFGDETRQAALFETMVLVAGADGVVSKDEVEEIYRRVFERPEFQGIHANDLKEAISHAAKNVAKAKDLGHILPTLSQRLPDQASRNLAFGLACSVAMADHRAHPSELAVLKALQNAFDIRESEVVALFEAAENHAPLPPTKPE
ncbi:MAG: tellurite resistance TerB family protein [Deltaproteobacteria bacterium]|nr:tellurite resistance TerB family protein [Deltaproteobacteria bacterium]